MRKRMRLINFDYGEPGPYFVTICLKNQWHLMGDVVDGSIVLNDVGRLIECEWIALEQRYPGLVLDSYAIMPNHFHGILVLPTDDMLRPVVTLEQVIGAFKSITSVAYGHGVAVHGWPRYERKLWQRSCWERVLRNDADLQTRREYVESNPWSWQDEVDAVSR